MRGSSPEREVYWRGILSRQAESGLSATQFCQREQIAAPSLYLWKRKLRVRDAGSAGTSVNLSSGGAEPSGFVPLRFEGQQVEPWKAAIRIHWRWGIQVEIPLAAGRDTIEQLEEEVPLRVEALTQGRSQQTPRYLSISRVDLILKTARAVATSNEDIARDAAIQN